MIVGALTYQSSSTNVMRDSPSFTIGPTTMVLVSSIAFQAGVQMGGGIDLPSPI